MIRSVLVGIFFAFVTLAESKSLPSYIIPCKKSAPDFDECCRKHATDAIPRILQGDKTYKIAPLLPFHIPLIDVRGQSGLKFQLKDLDLYGLNSSEVQAVKFDLAKKHIYVKVYFPKTWTTSTYNMDGKVLSLVLKGEGPARTSSENITVEYTIDYNLIKKDGKNYIDVDHLKTNLNLDIKKSNYNFENLFGGNKLLGDNFNNLLNENPKEVAEISGDSNKVIVNSVVESVFVSLFRQVPFDEVFME